MFAVGVDVSNGRSMVAVLGARRSVVVQPQEVPHTADGFAELAARLHALDGEDRIVMEHTGRYYESFAMSMYQMCIRDSHIRLSSVQRTCLWTDAFLWNF